MGTLGGDFLSSLPLHEYPPAFPLGADIQGMTRITAWGPGLPRPPRNQFRTLAPLQSFLAILQRATIQGTSLSLCVCVCVMKCFDKRLILIFLFLPGLDLFSFLQTESQVSGPFSTSYL